MNIYYLILNIIGVFAFAGIAFLVSKNKKDIPWLSVCILFALNLIIACFFLLTPIGKIAINSLTSWFTVGINKIIYDIVYVFGDAFFSSSTQAINTYESIFFFASVILPMIVIIPLLDILNYFGVVQLFANLIGTGLSKITRQKKFESFYSIMMMFFGTVEVATIVKYQLKAFKQSSEARILTIAMMSASCISLAFVASYCSLLPGEYILIAIPLNVINALIITSIINPVKVDKKNDIIDEDFEAIQNKEPFFVFFRNSIWKAGKIVLFVCANVIAFAGIVALVDLFLGLANPLIHQVIDWNLTTGNLIAFIMYIPSCLLGIPIGSWEAMDIAQIMGSKIATNEFIVISQLSPIISAYPQHIKCVVTVFLTSFANFSTIGLILTVFKEHKVVAKNIHYIFLSSILVSLMSAATAGLFVW